MKIKVRHRLTILLAAVLFSIGASVGAVSFAQSLEGLVTEGESFESIEIGKSTEGDVIAHFGDGYRLVDHVGYSYEMIYENLGLSFYYCQADPNKEIFVVEIKPPSKAVTAKGIKLGESTFADVFNIYGKWNETSAGFQYEGVYFHFEEEENETANANENVPNTQSKPANTESPTDGTNDAESVFVIDGEEVSSSRVGTLNSSNDLEVERPADSVTDSEDEAENDDDEDKSRVEVVKKKIVKRIELIEKDGLRQCGTKFSKK